MSEYKTLDEYFPDGKPDGRKFTYAGWRDRFWFQPYFKSEDSRWHGIDQDGFHQTWICDLKWKEWNPPKQTKKVKMYKPIRKGYENNYRTLSSDEWHTDKDNFVLRKDIVGYLELDAEVKE